MTCIKELSARAPYGMKMDLSISSRRIALVLVAALFPAVSPAADNLCPDLDVRISSCDAGLERMACAVAESHVERLASCGLSQSSRIDISITDSVTGGPANCVGAFHSETTTIEVLSPAALEKFTRGDSIYLGLAPEVIFETVLRHELGHALLYQTLAGREVGVAAHEYVAYALQIDEMSPDVRAVFLEANAVEPAQNLDIFNALIAGFAPGSFAAKAWLHFSQRENGCGFIEKLVVGDIILDGHIRP